MVFEEVDVADGRRWWMGMLEFTTDPASGLGHPVGDWQLPTRDTDNPADLPPFVTAIAAPPPGGRPAAIAEPSDIWEPDIKFAFGELPAHVEPPKDAKQMVELTAALGVVNELLTDRHQGTVVVRVAGRSWEQFVLGGDMPGPLLEMVRWIANHRLPAADGVAVAMIAIRPQDQPQVPGVQVIGEKDGQFVETWAPIEFPEGPKG